MGGERERDREREREKERERERIIPVFTYWLSAGECLQDICSFYF
jgi:hypothetical protein